MFGRAGKTSTPAPPRPELDPDRRCTTIARTTGTQCRRLRVSDDDHCSRHLPAQPGTALARTPAITASVASVQLDGVAWQTWKFGSRAWQAEAWRLYDITGQLRFVANWVGNSVSRCRLYVAEVDESGEAGEEARDAEVAALAAGPLGQGPAKDEALRLLGINLFIPGECYVIAESAAGDDGEDRWFVVSGKQIRRQGGQVTVRRSQLHGGGDMVFRQDQDLILRVWTPHPADTDEADSPTRSAIPDLREIEALRKREFAELDSRLAGAGILPLPEGIDFPRGDDDPPGLEGFQQMLQRAMATSLKNRADASALVPIMFTVPHDVLDKIKLVTFWTELSEQLLPLREAAVRSLAQSLDIPAEILTGMGESTHWNAWIISDDAIQSQIVPVLSRIAEAMTTGYLRRALDEMGKDPAGFVYAFDTGPLTARPNRSTDALNYHAALLLSDSAAIEAGAFRQDQMPDEEERIRRLVEKAIQGAPALLTDPGLRELIGITTPPPPPDDGEEPKQIPPAPAPVEDPEDMPEEPEQAAALVAVSSLAMFRALSLAGGRLIPHRQRDRWPGIPRHQLHTRHGPITRDQADLVLRGAWDDLDGVAEDLAVDPGQLRSMLHGFALELLTRGMAYDPRLLRDLVAAAVRGRRLTPSVGVGS